MRDELATILRLVAEGKLSADEAAPIIEALSVPRTGAGAGARPAHEEHAARHGLHGEGAARRRIRIQVNERGRRVVDVRVPLAFAAVAARSIPGIPDRYASLIEEAVDSETVGVIVDTEDENGDGVLITLE